jgi:hypothetical protein
MAEKGTNCGQFQPGDPRAGRPKGSTNKMTRAAKEAFSLAFEELGGVGGLVAWGRKHPGDFYRIYGRLIPTEQHIGNVDGTPLNFTLFVPPKAE